MPKPFIERKNNAILDVIELQKEGYTDIHFQGVHLLGGSESNKPYNECFFGELDSKDNNLGLDTLKPIYHLIGESESVIASEAKQSRNNTESNPIESKTNNTESHFTQSYKDIGNSTLQIFLNGNTLTLLNYSLLDSSLNIKLECNSSESKEIQEKEKTMRDCHEANASRNDNPQSTSMLHPILEDNEIKCPHNGVVKLKSNKGKSFTSKGIPMVLESDLLNAQILSYTNPMQYNNTSLRNNKCELYIS